MRERYNDKEKWKKPRRTKGRNWEMNQNNPFFRRKDSVKKKGLKANCPKTHVQGCVAPNPKKNKREKHLNKKRGSEEDHLKFAKRGRKKKKRKRRENPPHRSRKAIFGDDPNTDRKPDTPVHPLRVKFACAPGKMRKMPFSKRPRFCSPKGFLTL